MSWKQIIGKKLERVEVFRSRNDLQADMFRLIFEGHTAVEFAWMYDGLPEDDSFVDVEFLTEGDPTYEPKAPDAIFPRPVDLNEYRITATSDALQPLSFISDSSDIDWGSVDQIESAKMLYIDDLHGQRAAEIDVTQHDESEYRDLVIDAIRNWKD